MCETQNEREIGAANQRYTLIMSMNPNLKIGYYRLYNNDRSRIICYAELHGMWESKYESIVS